MVICFTFQLVGRLIPVNLLYKYKNVCLPDSDSYDIRFPTNASPSEKLLIILAGILIDYQYFEFSAGEPGQQGVGYYRYRY